jgi:hypothetical protein
MGPVFKHTRQQLKIESGCLTATRLQLLATKPFPTIVGVGKCSMIAIDSVERSTSVSSVRGTEYVHTSNSRVHFASAHSVARLASAATQRFNVELHRGSECAMNVRKPRSQSSSIVSHFKLQARAESDRRNAIDVGPYSF